MTHLSDEAVAAFADGVLTGPARVRATRHTQSCPECAAAVREQREAVFALRAAPAPELPCGLLDRLRGLPQVTPFDSPPTVVLPDGSAMLSTSGGLGSVSALAPTPVHRPEPAGRTMHWAAPVGVTAALVALTGVLVAGAAAADSEPTAPGAGNTALTVHHRAPADTTATDPTAPLFTAPAAFGPLNSGER